MLYCYQMIETERQREMTSIEKISWYRFSYTAEQRALLRGAITYFAQREDDEDDLDSVIGFDDDARVLSAVAEALGRPDLIVDIVE